MLRFCVAILLFGLRRIDIVLIARTDPSPFGFLDFPF